MNRRAYLAATTGVLATIAGCTSNSEEEPATTAPTATQTTTQTTQATADQETPSETSEATTEEQTTEEQTTEEQTTHPADQAIEEAEAHLEDAIAVINEYAGLNRYIEDITAADTDFPFRDIRDPIEQARDPIDRGLEDADTQAQQATLHSLDAVAGWLDSYVAYQNNLMSAHSALETVHEDVYDERGQYETTPDYEDNAESCRDALDRVENSQSGIMNVDTSVFEEVAGFDQEMVAGKQAQLRDEKVQIEAVVNTIPGLEQALVTFADAWSEYQAGNPDPEAFSSVQESCQSVPRNLEYEWRDSVASMGSMATCVANAVADGAGTMVEACTAAQDGNQSTADHRVETARDDVETCEKTGAVGQLDTFLTPDE